MKDKLIQVEDRVYDEDEIDLMDILDTILGNKTIIIITMLIITLVTFTGGYIYNKINRNTSIILSFEYPELELGKNPDGSIFMYNNIVSLKTITNIYNKYRDELNKEETLDEFRNRIRIEPIIPKTTQAIIDKALDRGEKVNYTSTNYKIMLNFENKELLNDLANEAINEFITKYKPESKLTSLNEKLYTLDYNDSYMFIKNKIKEIESIIELYSEVNYSSQKLGYSFLTLSDKVQSIKNVYLQDYYSYYNENNFTKDRNMRITRINSEITSLTLENESLLRTTSKIKEMLSELKPETTQILVSSLDNKSLNFENKDKYYEELVNKYFELNETLEKNMLRIKLLELNKEGLMIPNEIQENELEIKLQKVFKSINEVVEELNLLTQEYSDIKYSEIIKLLSIAEVSTKGKPLVLFLGVGIVLGGFIGIMLAFLKEFYNNYKKSRLLIKEEE